MNRIQWILGSGMALAALAVGLFVMWQAGQPRTPAAVAEAYFRAVYQHDYARAWQFISANDKQYKTRAQYLMENKPYTGLRKKTAERLAQWGEFNVIAVASTVSDHAIVAAQVKFPDPAQPEIAELLQAAETGQQGDLLAQLEAMRAAGKIRFVEEEQEFALTFTGGRWQTVLHWSGAVTVKLTAAVSPDLPWEFYPLQAEVQAMPGQTMTVMYHVKNLVDHPITGKAKHVVEPQDYRPFFETIQCFCFTEHTLAAGEEKDMPLIFRVDFAVPPEVTEFTNGYTFYPLESFPDEGMVTPTP